MEWTEWLRNYHRDHMEGYLREVMQECGLLGERAGRQHGD